MTEENLFTKVDSIPLYSDNIGYVSLFDSSHANESEEQRIWTVTTLASLAYGNDLAKNPEELYKRMQSIKHESLWEFIRSGYAPQTIEYSDRNQQITYVADIEQHKQNIACFRIKVPIFVARQFMRHRSFSYLEMSRRYTKDSKQPFEFWSPHGFTFDSERVLNEYAECIAAGMHTQVASRFLPQTTYTEFYMMGEVEGLHNYFRLRLDAHAQEPIRQLSEAMLSLLEKHQPELAAKVYPST